MCEGENYIFVLHTIFNHPLKLLKSVITNCKPINLKKLTLLFLILAVCSCKQTSSHKDKLLFANTTFTPNRPPLNRNLHKYIKYKSDTLALTHVTIFDGKGNAAKHDQTLIIINGHFYEMGSTSEIKIPSHARVLNAKGKTIIPGIVGVHNHLHIPRFPFVGETAAKLYLASGVTTIQTCGAASPEQEVLLAEQIEKGNAIGPNIITSGPYFTGINGNPNLIIPKNEQHIRDTIQYWAAKGVRWFKAYRNVSPEDLQIIIDEAHQQNAKVTGHLCSVTFEEATKMGIDGIEHGLNSTSDFRKNKTPGICNGSREYIDELEINSAEVKKLQQLMIDQQAFLTSTLAIYEASIPERAFADERSLEAMSPYLVSQYQERRKNYEHQSSPDSIRLKRLKRIMEFEYQFYKMGGTLTAGVDAGRHVLPGYGDQRNFELLREAGFTKQEALKIMTSNGAQVLDNPDIGTIEKGKKADFVILEGSLENSIRNIEYVFKDGYGYDPQQILSTVKDKFGLE